MIRVAILLTVTFFQQGTGPIPRPPQPSITKQQSSQPNKQKSETDRSATKPNAPAGNSQPATNSSNQNPQTVESRNNESMVRVISFPPVTTTRDIPTFVVSMVLALIGIVGIGVAIWTVRVIKRQTKATEDAAKAAAASVAAINSQTAHVARQALSMRRQTTILRESLKTSRKNTRAALLNAQAAVNAERPWLLVEVIPNGNDPYRWIVRAVNKGRTPAEMFEGHCECKMQPVKFRPPDDLIAPFFAPPQRVTVSDDSFEIMQINPYILSAGSESEPMAPMVYGKILYWDMFTERADTRAIHKPSGVSGGFAERDGFKPPMAMPRTHSQI